jgi:hypothetical protein
MRPLPDLRASIASPFPPPHSVEKKRSHKEGGVRTSVHHDHPSSLSVWIQGAPLEEGTERTSGSDSQEGGDAEDSGEKGCEEGVVR